MRESYDALRSRSPADSEVRGDGFAADSEAVAGAALPSGTALSVSPATATAASAETAVRRVRDMGADTKEPSEA